MMRLRLIFLVGILTAVLILICMSTVNGSPSPKKRGGSSGSKSKGSSSSSGSSGSRTSWFGGKKKGSSSGKSPGSTGYKPSKSGISKKSFSNGKKWKKALAFGAGAYIGAKVIKKVNIILIFY